MSKKVIFELGMRGESLKNKNIILYFLFFILIFNGSIIGGNSQYGIEQVDSYSTYIGYEQRDFAGDDVSNAGDINGDGFDDFLIGTGKGEI